MSLMSPYFGHGSVCVEVAMVGQFEVMDHPAGTERSPADQRTERKIKDMWTLRSKRFLQAELKRRGITYAELARRMSELGVRETEGSLTVKINRGTFPVWFFFAALKAIGCPQVRLEDV